MNQTNDATGLNDLMRAIRWLTGGTTAEALGTIAPIQWARSGFQPLGGIDAGFGAAATFTTLETGVLAVTTAGINYVAQTAAFEAGVLIGAAINAGAFDCCP